VRAVRPWAGVVLLAACNPNTTRPPITPIPGALEERLGVDPARAVALLVDALRADSLPVTVIRDRDAYLETPWFDGATGEPTTRRPLGDGVVRLRAWIDLAAARDSHVTLELTFRPLADPSAPERDLDRLLPADHPAAQRAKRVLDALKKRYPPAIGG